MAGNAGRCGRQYHLHITDKHGTDRRKGRLPAPVDVLDENVFVLRRDRLVSLSYDLRGYHLYGLDIVLQARALGLSAWAIDFWVEHMGAARVDARYLDCLDRFEAKAAGLRGSKLQPTLVETVELRAHPWRFFWRAPRRLLRRRKILRRAARMQKRPPKEPLMR